VKSCSGWSPRNSTCAPARASPRESLKVPSHEGSATCAATSVETAQKRMLRVIGQELYLEILKRHEPYLPEGTDCTTKKTFRRMDNR
jgi:hypothetical protein